MQCDTKWLGEMVVNWLIRTDQISVVDDLVVWNHGNIYEQLGEFIVRQLQVKGPDGPEFIGDMLGAKDD